MGTNNPSEEQLALVEQRLIALADTVVDPLTATKSPPAAESPVPTDT